MVEIHPNLVKRPIRIRKSYIGKFAWYYPTSLLTKPDDLEVGDKVHIMNYEYKNKTNTLVKVESGNGKEFTVMATDLGFIE